MMRLKKLCPLLIVTTALIFPSLAGCGPAPVPDAFTPATVTGKPISENNQHYRMNLDIPVIAGMADENFQSQINAALEADALAFAGAIQEQSQGDMATFQAEGIPWQPYEIASSWELHLSNQQVISLSVDYYSFTGGAHGLTSRSCYNYLLPEGRMLTLPTIFSQGSPWKEKLTAYVLEEIESHPEEYFPLESPDGLVSVNDGLQFFLTEDSLVLNFGLYEIAPYASGMPQITIPAAELTDILSVRW